MAERTIKTKLQLDGERQFKAAITASKQELKVLGSELKAASAEYQLNGDKMDYLGKRTDVLTREIAEQEKVIRQTSEMLQKAAAGGEEYTSKVNKLKIDLNNSNAALSRMKKELQDTDRELEELGRDSLTAGRNIEHGITDAAEDASQEIRDMVEEMNTSLGSIDLKTSLEFGQNLVQGAFQLIQGVDQWATASIEYNRKVAMLKTNATLSSADWDDVEKEFLRVAGLTGDADAAVEGLSNLLQAGVTNSAALNEMVDLLSGAIIKWPDTFKFESLADSLQETIAKQEATGQFAELLERMGIGLEDFNKALQTSQGEAADLNLVMGILATGGLKDAYDAYTAINGGIAAAEEAEQRLNYEIQTLGGYVAVWFTPAKAAIADLLGAINEAIEQGKTLNEVFAEESDILPDEITEGMSPEDAAQLETDAFNAVMAAANSTNPFSWISWIFGDSSMHEQEYLDTLHKIEDLKKQAEEGIEIPAEFVGPPTPKEWAEQWEQQNTGMEIDIPVDTDSDAALTDLSSTLEDYAETANAHGITIGEALGAGIDSGLAEAETQLRRRMAEIDRILTSGGSGGSTMTGGTNPAANLVANMQVDGKTFARVMMPYIDREQGKQWKTNLS